MTHNVTVRCQATEREPNDNVDWFCARPANHAPGDHAWTNPESLAEQQFALSRYDDSDAGPPAE